MELLQVSGRARVLPAGPDSIYWMTGSKQGSWSSPHLGELVALLSQPATRAHILDRLPEAAPALDGMIGRGLVEFVTSHPALTDLCRESAISRPPEQNPRWQSGVSIDEIDSRPAASLLCSTLGALGVPIRDGAPLRLVITSDYLDRGLHRIQQECRQSGITWIPARLVGEEIWLGPVFAAGHVPCWSCLAIRLSENLWLRTQIPHAGPAPEPCAGEGRMLAGAEFLAQEVARWLLDAPNAIDGAVWSFSWATLRSQRHPIAGLPNCPACRPPVSVLSAEPVKLCKVVVSGELPWRVSTPQSLIDRLESLASPVTGIMRRIARRDLEPLPPLFTFGGVISPALPPQSLRFPGAVLQPGICSGRGLTVDEAKAACLAEAVERYSLQFRGDEPRIFSSFRDIGGGAIHPSKVLLFSERQYACRDAWNRTHEMEEGVPHPLGERDEIEWTKGWSLTAGQARFLPTALCAEYYRPSDKLWIGDADSNGCAAGGCVEEAIFYAILELIERDSLSIWWFNGVSRPAFRADSVPDSVSRTICAGLEQQSWQVSLVDITTDIDVPVFVSIATRNGAWIRGSGCHPNPVAAMRESVCELWQLSRSSARLGPPPHTVPLKEQMAIAESGIDATLTDLKAAIEHCVALLLRIGCELVVFDLTRPEIGFPVFRAIAPGLRSLKPRFAPGRLYDVPVRKGWLGRARREEEFPVRSA